MFLHVILMRAMLIPVVLAFILCIITVIVFHYEKKHDSNANQLTDFWRDASISKSNITEEDFE